MEREGFEEQALESLNEQLGTMWIRYGFQNLLDQVLEVMELAEDKPENLTVLTSGCLSIIAAERNRMRRIDRWKDRQKETSEP